MPSYAIRISRPLQCSNVCCVFSRIINLYVYGQAHCIYCFSFLSCYPFSGKNCDKIEDGSERVLIIMWGLFHRNLDGWRLALANAILETHQANRRTKLSIRLWRIPKVKMILQFFSSCGAYIPRGVLISEQGVFGVLYHVWEEAVEKTIKLL